MMQWSPYKHIYNTVHRKYKTFNILPAITKNKMLTSVLSAILKMFYGFLLDNMKIRVIVKFVMLIFIGTTFQWNPLGWMAASMCRMTFSQTWSVTSEGDVTGILRERWGMR